MGTEMIRGHLDALLLAILADGPRHGYAIIEELRRRSGEVLDLPEGSVYPALYRLEHSGAITSSRSTVGGRSRRIYRLGRRGRAALEQRRGEWMRFSAAVSHILGQAPT
jgi:DNA-binding PadR family transcriptional regulator